MKFEAGGGKREKADFGIPYEVFKALIDSTRRFPQSFSASGPAVSEIFLRNRESGTTFPEMFGMYLSKEGMQRMTEIATRAHGARGVMSPDDPTKPRVPHPDNINRIWSGAKDSVNSFLLELMKKTTTEKYSAEATRIWEHPYSFQRELLEETGDLLEKIYQEDPTQYAFIKEVAVACNGIIDTPEGDALAKEIRDINDKNVNPDLTPDERRAKSDFVQAKFGVVRDALITKMVAEHVSS